MIFVFLRTLRQSVADPGQVYVSPVVILCLITGRPELRIVLWYEAKQRNFQQKNEKMETMIPWTLCHREINVVVMVTGVGGGESQSGRMRRCLIHKPSTLGNYPHKESSTGRLTNRSVAQEDDSS